MITTFNSYSYRYGFNGQETDDEVKGEGNSVNYKYRMHDTRIGRFFAIDPLAPKYPHNGPYNFSENRVIDAIELEGLEALLVKKIEFGDKTILLVIPDSQVKENSLAQFQIRIPKGTFNGQDKELVYFKDSKTSADPKFDFIELQQNLYENFKIKDGHIIYNGEKKGASTGYGGNGLTNNMADFSIRFDMEDMQTQRDVKEFGEFLELETGDITNTYVAPQSEDGYAHYSLNLVYYGQGSNEGVENVITVTNNSTGTVLVDGASVNSVGGQISFNIQSGNSFSIHVNQNAEVGSGDIYEYQGTVTVGK